MPKKDLLIIIVITILISLMVKVNNVLEDGTSRLIEQIARFVIQTAVFVYLYKTAKKESKWGFVGVYGFIATFALVIGIPVLDAPFSWEKAVLIFMMIFFSISTIYLGFIKKWSAKKKIKN